MTVLFLLCGCAAPVEPVEQVAPTLLSYAIVEVGTGEVLAAQDADRPMLPASTAKLVTALSVLQASPISQRFETKLCRDGENLRLIGDGDPSLDVEDLFALALASQVELSGVTRFTYFPSTSTGPIQPDQPTTAAYNPSLSGLMVAEGAYHGMGGTDGWTVPDGAPTPVSPSVDWYAHPDPPRQAADLFRSYAAGLGHILPSPTPGTDFCDQLLASVRSEPIPQLVREMLWTSSNPMAEMLGRAALDEPDAGAWLNQHHSDLKGFQLNNFSGLDGKARVVPLEMATFLAREAERFPGFPSILTPAGWDGGLRNRLMEPPFALSIWAKTGTMHYGVGLAGYGLIPGRGLVAIAFYAFDPDARAAYDPLSVTVEGEKQARDWISYARLKIDDALMAAFLSLMSKADAG